MHHKPRRLIYNQKKVIFIDDIERYIFRYDLEIIAWTVHDNAYDISRFYLITGFDRFAIHNNTSGIGGLLDPVSRSLFHPLHKKLVHSQ